MEIVVKSSVEYQQEIIAILEAEKIDARAFLISTSKIPNHMKVYFRMMLYSNAFEAPMNLVRQGGFSAQLIEIEQIGAGIQKQVCLDWTRNAWAELREKGVVK